MHVCSRMLAPGLAKRSLDEAVKFVQLAWSQDAIRDPYKPLPLLDFTDADTVSACKTMSDADLGAFSSAKLSHMARTPTDPVHARFHGSISTELPRNNPQVQRTGYAGWRNRDRGWTLFGKLLWDLERYTYLGLRVKSDGRKYYVNIQTESIVYEDLHQHRLHTHTPGEWETIYIDLSAFVRTNYGEIVEPQSEMMTQKIRTIGMSLTDRVPGPFDLAINKIWASPGLQDEGIPPDAKPS